MQNKSFPMNINLCNVTTMTNYVDQSKHLRNSQTFTYFYSKTAQTYHNKVLVGELNLTF